MERIHKHGLGLIGCGFMGQALVKGWIATGIDPQSIYVSDPHPSDWLTAQTGIQINAPFPKELAALVIAIKPQSLNAALPSLSSLGGGQTVIVSIAAGATTALFERHFGGGTPVVRVMPNLPAAVGAAASALYANTAATDADIDLITSLFECVGTVTRLPDEDLLHAVTGVSGSGPAYIFAMSEALAFAGERLGIPPELAKMLAAQTIAGAGKMLSDPNVDAVELRKAVTSKGGTTAAGLDAMMADGQLNSLMQRTVDAARKRSVELGID